MVNASSGGVSGTQDPTVPGGGILDTAGAPRCSTGVTGAPGSDVVGAAASGAGGAGRAVPDSAADSSHAVNTPRVPAPTVSRNPRRSMHETVASRSRMGREPDGESVRRAVRRATAELGGSHRTGPAGLPSPVGWREMPPGGSMRLGFLW